MSVVNNWIHRLILVLIALQCGILWADDADRVRFAGKGNDLTDVFGTDGPWMLDWSIRSDVPLLGNFEMRLHDGGSGDFIGTIVQLEGTGSGLKLFEQGGDYRIAVVASNIAWELEISAVSERQAAEIKRLTDDRPSLQDSSRKALRRVREGSFNEWRPVGNDTLLLFGTNRMGWRATFPVPCPGLESAEAISFVTPATGDIEEYDSILLDDGTRCYFDRVVPTILD